MAFASERFEFPANILTSSFTDLNTLSRRAGREGVEPSLPDPKSGALPAWRPPKIHDPLRRPDPRESGMLVFAIPDVNRMEETKRHVAGAGALWHKSGLLRFDTAPPPAARPPR